MKKKHSHPHSARFTALAAVFAVLAVYQSAAVLDAAGVIDASMLRPTHYMSAGSSSWERPVHVIKTHPAAEPVVHQARTR